MNKMNECGVSGLFSCFNSTLNGFYLKYKTRYSNLSVFPMNYLNSETLKHQIPQANTIQSIVL